MTPPVCATRYAEPCEADPPIPGCWHCPECGTALGDGLCPFNCGKFSPPPDAGRPVNPAPVEPVKDDGPIDGLKWVEWPSNESTYKTHGLDVREDEGATDADE